ncbi:MAG: carboxypeptidase regulatory-like domain-containing protein, partial [Longimicrobiales bacterium]
MGSTLVGACMLALVIQTAPQAWVAGVVRDAATGLPLSGAAVVLSDLDRAALTSPDGRYALAAVPPGPQHLTVRQIGYTSRTLHLLVPPAGRLEIDVSLEPSPILLEGIVIAPRRPIRGVDPADSTRFPDRGTTHAALQNHPTLAQRDALMALGGGEVVLEPEAPTGVHVRGGAADHTGFVLDGVPVLNPYHAAGVFGAWNADALAVVQLNGVAPPPELPDALSGVIVARTREPGHRLRVHSALSTVEARVTVDGPAGVAGAAYLLSWRAGLAGALAPGDEASYLAGETADFMAKLQVPVLGGTLRLLLYDAENELTSADTVLEDDAPPDALGSRNAFDWGSRSLGVSWDWSRRGAVVGGGAADLPGAASGSGMNVSLGAWRAAADASASWHAASAAHVVS